jgi:hypothetical protein
VYGLPVSGIQAPVRQNSEGLSSSD